MIYIPDLFSPYAKGREEAIKQNWIDLENFESVQGARIANDQAQLDYMGAVDDYGNNRQASNAEGTKAYLQEELMLAQQPANLAEAKVGNMWASDSLQAYNDNRGLIQDGVSGRVASNANKMYTDALYSYNKAITDEKLLPQRNRAAYAIGNAKAQTAYDDATRAPLINNQNYVLGQQDYANSYLTNHLAGEVTRDAIAYQPIADKEILFNSQYRQEQIGQNRADVVANKAINIYNTGQQNEADIRNLTQLRDALSATGQDTTQVEQQIAQAVQVRDAHLANFGSLASQQQAAINAQNKNYPLGELPNRASVPVVPYSNQALPANTTPATPPNLGTVSPNPVYQEQPLPPVAPVEDPSVVNLMRGIEVGKEQLLKLRSTIESLERGKQALIDSGKATPEALDSYNTPLVIYRDKAIRLMNLLEQGQAEIDGVN